MASVDAMMKNPSMMSAMRGGGGMGGTDIGMKDLESQLKKLTRWVGG